MYEVIAEATALEVLLIALVIAALPWVIALDSEPIMLLIVDELEEDEVLVGELVLTVVVGVLAEV